MLGAGTGPHVFVDDVHHPELGDEDRHHLARVLRVRAGDALTVSDGRGSWRTCRFGDGLEVTGDIRTEAPAAPALTIGFALVKGERPELIVQKLTELAVDRIVPFLAARSVVRPEPQRLGRQVERWRRVAREAAMQSRRAWLPVVEEPVPFTSLAGEPGACLADRDGAPPSLDLPLVLVGPEGGWAAEERAAVGPRVAFGTQVLRAETACFAAAAVMVALRQGIVRPQSDGGHLAAAPPGP